MPQIVVEDLRKSFFVAQRRKGLWGAATGLIRRQQREVHALEGISFALQAGELVGYIGPNGAGKSTTVKILSGILVPTSGRCEVAGRVPWKQRIQHVQNLGVVFGQRTQLWWDLPVVESFELLRDIYRVDNAAYQRSINELIALLDLEKLLDVPVRQLSLGQRMRGDLAAALLHAPPILFLDEPTIGLDAVSKLAEVAAMIRSGNVAYELVRPVDLYNYWLARSFSGRAAPMVLRAGPILLIAFLIGDLHAPPSILHGALFILSIALGLLLAAVIFAAITISMLWTVSGEGAARLAPSLVFFLSGMIIPLPLFPEFLQPLIRALPFRGMIDVPFRIYLGQLEPHAILLGFIQQLIWIALFILLGRTLLSRGLKKLVAQGG